MGVCFLKCHHSNHSSTRSIGLSYIGQDWGVTQYSSLIYLALGLLLGLTVIQAVLGREPKAKVA